MQFWALIIDSLRESLDRKIFWILVGLTLLITLSMLGVGFDGEEVTLFFGMWSTESDRFNPLSDIGRANLVGFVVYLLANTMMGWIGVTLMIIATAGAFPAFTERGALDVVLAKPINRARLFLYKYFATMVFVVLQGTLFFVLTFLVMWLRWGVWVPGYLLSIVFLVLLFSYLYCVSVLVAVKTRSAVAAILLTLLAWVLFAMIHQAPSVFETFPELKKRRTVYAAARVLSWIPPKTGDFPYLAASWSQAGTSIDSLPYFDIDTATDLERTQIERARQVEEQELAKNQFYSVGSSLLFEIVVVLLAMWTFARKDY